VSSIVAKSIEEILKREKVWKPQFFVDVQEVVVRKDTIDEGGHYQYDFQMFKRNEKIELSGTVYGSISAGDLIDMTLELYDKRIW